MDSGLCAQVAAGLGLPVPTTNQPTRAKVMPSPALSQLGRTWPVDGRIIGIVVDPAQLAGVRQLRDAIFGAGMVPLLIAPHGGTLDGELQAQRTFLTARSVEFDALLLSASPPPAPDARPSRDAKAGTPDGESTVDPRVLMMVQECFRHAKAIGAWGSGTLTLEASGYGQGNPGVVVDDDPDDVLKQIMTLLSTHRVWERSHPRSPERPSAAADLTAAAGLLVVPARCAERAQRRWRRWAGASSGTRYGDRVVVLHALKLGDFLMAIRRAWPDGRRHRHQTTATRSAPRRVLA